jgi:hypothetical protein
VNQHDGRSFALDDIACFDAGASPTTDSSSMVGQGWLTSSAVEAIIAGERVNGLLAKGAQYTRKIAITSLEQ